MSLQMTEPVSKWETVMLVCNVGALGGSIIIPSATLYLQNASCEYISMHNTVQDYICIL